MFSRAEKIPRKELICSVIGKALRKSKGHLDGSQNGKSKIESKLQISMLSTQENDMIYFAINFEN